MNTFAPLVPAGFPMEEKQKSGRFQKKKLKDKSLYHRMNFIIRNKINSIVLLGKIL